MFSVLPIHSELQQLYGRLSAVGNSPSDMSQKGFISLVISVFLRSISGLQIKLVELCFKENNDCYIGIYLSPSL